MNRDMRVGVVLALDPRLLKSGAAEAQQVFNATFDSMVASAGSASNAVKRLADTQALLNTAQRNGLKVTDDQKQALDALRRATESQGKAFEQAAKAQQAWNEQLNVKADFGIQQRSADIQAYGSALDDVRAKFNPLFAAQQAYKRQLDEIAAAKRVGAINAREETEAIQRTKTAFAAHVVQINRARDAATQHGGAVKLQAYQMANLLQQFQDIAVQAGSGTSPFVILLQQGPQITSAMGGMRNAFGLVMQALTPMRIGLGLAAAGIALVTARAADIAGESRAAGVSIRAFGKEAEITTGQIHGLVEQMRDLGIAKDDARDAIDASLRVPRATGADVARAAGLAPDFAAGFKTSIADAQVQLTELGTKGYAAIKKLDEAYNFLSADQARMIRELTDQGRQAEATEIAFAALEARIKGLAKDAMTPAGRLLNEFGRAWTRTIDLLANSGPVIATLSALGQGLNKVSDWLERSAKQSASPGSDLAQINADIAGLERSRSPKWVQPQLEALERRREAILSSRLQSSEDDRIAANRALAGAGSASQPRADQQATKYVDEQTKAYQRQEEVLRSSAGSRELVRARLEAESEARERNIEGSAREELIAVRVREAKLRLATAANDNLVALKAEAAGSLAVAEAYRLSETAGRAAEASLQARMAALQNSTVDEKSLATAIRERAAAQSLVETTKSARNLAYEAADQEKLVAASRQGAEASREAARQIEVESFRRQALAAATDKTREAVLAEIEVYDQASRRRQEAQRQIERETVLRKAAQDASVAAAEAQAAAISDPALRRQAELAIARQQKINELTEQYGTVADGTGRKLLEMWDAAQQSREQARFFDDVRSKAQELAGDIKGFMLDGLTGVYNNGKSIFENMWDAALKGAKRFALNVALTFAEQAIVMPVMMQLVSSAPGLFGVTAPQSAPGAMISGGGLNIFGGGPGIITGYGGGTFNAGGLPGAGGGFGLGSFNPFSALSSASNFFPGIGSTINSFGASAFGLASGATISTASANALGISAGQAALLNNAGATGALGSTTLSGLLGGVGLGFGAGSLLNSLVGGNPTGGMIGSGVGATAGAIIGSIVPGVGTLLGGLIGGSGGGLLGGLFGGKKSVGPIGHTNINAQDGRLVVGTTGVDNGADPNVTISQAQQLVQAANALADKYSLVINGGTSIAQGNASGPKSAATALQELINNGAFTSSDAVVQQILKASRGKSVEAFEENLQFADVYKSFAELQKPANAAADAIRETAKAYQETKTKAQELGLSLTALQEGAAANTNQDLERQLKAILDPQALALEDFAVVAEERLKYVQEVGADMAKAEQLNMLQRQQILQQGLQGMTGTLQQWLDNQLLGSTSNLTGVEKLGEAQTQFQSAKSAGNTNRVLELADYIANIATELYGGTLQGAQLVDWTRSQVKEYGKSLGLPGFAVGTSSAPAGWAWVGEAGPELMHFRGGEQVLPHRLSVAVANNNMPGDSREDFIQLAMLLASINADTSALRRDLPVNNDLLRNLVDRLDRYLTAADQLKRVA